jgi:NAD(P)-dependent dehydrogenase (short-subunit alcohol dehydrogenase family)
VLVAEHVLGGVGDTGRYTRLVQAVGQARFVAADLSDPTELRRLADEAGEVDVPVNNAGFSWFGPTADLDVATFDALFDSNVRAPYFLVAALAPKMAANGGGSIINVASMVGVVGVCRRRRLWRHEGDARGHDALVGSRVQPSRGAGQRGRARPGVHPPPTQKESRRSGPPLLGRAAQAEEIAQVITFLASPASAYITGATVAADGGTAV